MTERQATSLSWRLRWIVMPTLVFLVVAIDQASKAHAISQWKGMPPQFFLGGLFQIRYAENSGAFLSLFANLPNEVRFWILTIGNGAMLAGLAAYLLGSRRISLTTFVALSLLIGGGIGNLIDRARFQCVIDFFYIEFGFLHTGVFNIADMAITAAFLIMIPMIFRKELHPIHDLQASTTGDQQSRHTDTLKSTRAVEGSKP